MKKINLAIYYTLFIIYQEIVFSGLINKTESGIFLTVLLSIPIAITLTIISLLFSKKINKIITYILTTAITILFGAQIIYYKIYEAFLSVYSIINGKQVTEFMDVIFSKILENWYAILLIIIPLIILIILNKKKILIYERHSIKKIAIEFATLILIQIIALVCINTINTNSMYSNKNLYYNIHIPKLTAKNMGVLTTMRLDLQRFLFGFEENLPINLYVDGETIKEYDYNVTDIDFDKLIESETDEKVIKVHEYFKEKQPTNKNEYTGMFEGKNIIAIVGESFSSLAIREDITPNLYKLYSEGFQFDNFYTPVFPVSTADGEYITDLSVLPKEGVWSFKEIVGNYEPYSYPNVFKKLGYTTNAYHNHTSTFYERDKYIETLGYDSFTAIGTGLEKKINADLWPESDYEMMKATIDDYINNDKFLAYYMTVSGHLGYSKETNAMTERNWDKVEDLPYSDKAKSYLAANIELDKAIGELLNRLEQAGKLEDTVIILSGDHHPYGLKIDEINELSQYERDDKFEKCRMPFIIWSGSMKEPVKVEKLGSSLDILPTVLNLFGVEFDSRLLIGKDILSNASPLVIFSDRSFITEKGKYDAITNTFVPNKGEKVDENYIEKINQTIYQDFRMSTKILEYNYYKKVFK